MKARTRSTSTLQAKAEQDLFEGIAKMKTSEEAEKLLRDLCTPAELQAIADRLLVVGPIKEGKPYRKIHEETGVSITTVGRVARCLNEGTGGYDLIFNRINNKD